MSNLLEQHFQQSLTRSFGLVSLSLICIGIVVCTFSQSAMAQAEKPTGSSHRSHRAAGIQAIPFDKMNVNAQKRIKDVVSRPSFYRRLPVQTIDADPEYFRLLVRRPELIVSIWQLMGVTQMSTERTGPFTVKTNDGAGTISDLELVYGNEKLHVFYGNGSYTGPMLKQKLTGRCVIVLQTQAIETATGFDLTNVLDIYLRVDNATASLITRTIQPLVGTTADHNFTESLKFVQRLNQSTRNNGPGVKGMGRKLQIDAQVRKDFEVVVDKVYERASSKRQHANLGNQSSAPIATRPPATRPPTLQSRTAQSPPPQMSRRVQANEPVLIRPARQVKHQPVVSPALVSEPPRIDRTTAPLQARLSGSVPRKGISVLVGGPRDLSETAAPFVSVADSSNLANPEFDPSRFQQRSSQQR